ncbi:uncharacterized protein At1g76070-like [Typha angustifolia]|uniref:uncharacterized protein At1g76070-like n=1 Tax=Typha angustifolia TaxID=59011 RepID=UPI003C308D22
MEKSSRSVGTNIFAFLGKPAPISVYHNKGFSGPIVPLIPMEARRSKEKDRRGGNFETEEPTSPKVSCMGQIKHKKMACKLKQRPPPPARRDQKRVSFAVPKIFFRRKARPMHRVGDEERQKVRMVRAPSIARMRRYASGRESALRNFDWKKAEKGR